MPTAAKLCAAIAFGLVGFFTAEVLKPQFPEGFSFGLWSPLCGLLGVVVGWTVMGANAGRGAGRAVTTGLRTSATLLFWGLLAFSIREMLIRSTDRRYDGVTEALVGTFDILLEYGTKVVTSVPALAVLAAGGALGGLFANWAAERFR